MKKLYALFLSLAITLSVITFPAPAYAQGEAWGDCVVNDIPTLRCIPVVFGNVVNAALMLAGTVAAFLIVYAGIRFVTSGGDPKKVSSARQILTYALIGLVLVLLSFAIIYLISYLTNTECITNTDFGSCS